MDHKSQLVVLTAAVLAVGMLITPVAAQSGLVASTTAQGDTSVAPGETFEVTYTLTNDGDATANSAGFNPSLPDGISVVSVSGDGTNSPARFITSPIGPGESVTVTYTFEAAGNVSSGQSLEYNVTGFLESEGDTDTATRTIDIQTATPEASLSVAAPSSGKLGDTVDVQYTLSNTGDGTASSAGLNLTLPEGISVASASGAGTNTPDRFFLDPISPGDQVVVTYTLDVAADAPTGDATIEAEGVLETNETSSSSQQSTTLTLDRSLSDAIADSQGRIGFSDTINVIVAFNNGEQVVGQDVSFADVIEVIQAFNSQQA